MIGGAKGIGIGIDFGLPNLYRKPSGKSYIDPDVLASLRVVTMAYGKTNNDSDRAIVKNLVDPDNPFIISNAAYKLNSGYGKYSADFESFDWAIGISQKQHNKASISLNGRLCNHAAIEVDEMKVNIIGNVTELIYWYIANPDDTARSEIRLTSGINILPKSYAKDDGQIYNIGFAYISGDSEITIEQIPSFEGAFVTDGVDDLIKSTKSATEMLDGSNEVTVVSMIHQIKTNDDTTRNNWFFTPVSYLGNRVVKDKIGKTGIYGYTSTNVTNAQISDITPILGDKNDYTLYSKIEDGDRDYFTVEGFQNQGIWYVSSIAWYWTIIANKVLTTDQINQVIAYFNLDRTLNPDILCNVKKQGITNENHAEFGDKLIDFSGNGRDIQLNNIAWDGDSGIGKYNYPNWKVNVTQGNKYARIVYYDSINGTYSADFKGVTELYKSYGLSVEIRVNRANTVDFHSIKEDGIYTITPPDDTTSMDIRFGGENVYNASCDITITQIPSHAGALYLDGVNDFGKVTGMPVYKDYTIIADYERFYLEPITGGRASILSKSSKVGDGSFIFNLEDQDGGKSCYTFGEANGNISDDITRIIRYQSKYYNTKTLSIGTAEDNDFMVLGKVREVDSRHFCGAIYSLMSFPYSMSEFLIERQLKKHKLGTLYPNMMEFRPIIKSNIDTLKINYWDKDWNVVNVGDYVSVGNDIKTNITVPNGYKVSKATSDAFDNITIEKSSTDFIYDVKFYGIKKSPQKIGITIEQDENYVKFEPVITSNVEYVRLDFYLNNYQKRINIGDYIPKDAYLIANFYLKNNVDELTVFTFNGVNIDYRRSSVDDTAFNINQIYNYDSPQEVDITIDEYIRYEDIVQPYPALLRFNDENGNEVSWGGKFKVGSTITRIGSAADSNLLPNIYNIFGLLLNGNQVTSSKVIVEKTMVFKAKSAYIFDNNEPKCILSPRLLRIPNSSYKILGYIPDISGHGNNGVIHNSAYAEGSGVNEDGSYQFDGVDDFVAIPTLSSGGKQVLMKVNWHGADDEVLYDQRNSNIQGNYDLAISTYPDTIAYNFRNEGGKTFIDGILNSHIITNNLKNITHNISSINGYNNDNNSTICIGKSVFNGAFAQMALYDFMLFDNVSTDDKIKQLNEYVGIEAKVELPPYYWDAYGKTNLDGDKATIQQRGVAVGDYDLTNYNHAYEGMSGYNGYPVVFGANKTWEKESNGYVTSITSNTIHITNVLKAGLALLYSYVKYNDNLQNIKEIPPFKIEIKGLEGRSKFIYKYLATSDATKETNLYLGNGTHELPKSFLPTEALISNAVVGFSISPIEEGVTNFLSDITIEVLPEYSNGLVYDGITDYSKNANIPALDDFTVIAKRVWMNKDNPMNECFIHKGVVSTPIRESALMLEYEIANDTYYRSSSYGGYINIERSNRPERIVYQTSNSYNGTPITKGSGADSTGIVIGAVTNNYWNGVFYKLILYPKTIPLLQINFLKNLMERDEIIDLNNPIFIQE